MTEGEYIPKLEKIQHAVRFINSVFRNNCPVTFGEKIDEQTYGNRYQTKVVGIKITEDAIQMFPGQIIKLYLTYIKEINPYFIILNIEHTVYFFRSKIF
ncbi:MAG: hypothetical protein ACEY3A_05620 [Wolbachia sp.]